MTRTREATTLWFERALRPGPHWWVAALGVAVAIFWLSSLPALEMFTPGPPEGLLNAVFKKTAHVLMYGALAVGLHRAFSLRPRTWPFALLIALLYGISDEWHQSFVPGREPAARDVAFDVLGASLALWLHQRVVESTAGPRSPAA